jgi:hypothetical protein
LTWLHLIDVETSIPKRRNGKAVANIKLMHTELARFPLVSGVQQRLVWAESQTDASSDERVSPKHHVRWNKVLGLATLLGVSAGGWTLLGIAIERIVR